MKGSRDVSPVSWFCQHVKVAGFIDVGKSVD